ncbi:mediator complex, subunit Med20 [Boeremia exigua]|uniref:mediator complex, subunit Med20 n=1 Tax=Boeremia exigua TaxID=749465 RepID=UPI001E8D4ABB|nr:mediator complex, subunit Med20 [Boeremia exigua]KAH6625623.1 mediator complex, subunit Med20 [Boeremia exigua]
MKYSGLYFIPSPTAQPAESAATASALTSSLETHFHTLARGAPWTLTYRLFRDTAPRADPENPVSYAHSHTHLLTHTALSQSRCYVHVSPPPGTRSASVVAIPFAQADAQAALLRNQMAALWSARHTLSIQNGATYAGGLFAVQIGEVRVLREAQGGGVSSPGVVVCVSTVAGGEEDGVDGQDVDLEFAQATIREFWGKVREGRDLGRAEVREVFMAPEQGREDKDAMVRMWCEVLRLRG